MRGVSSLPAPSASVVGTYISALPTWWAALLLARALAGGLLGFARPRVLEPADFLTKSSGAPSCATLRRPPEEPWLGPTGQKQILAADFCKFCFKPITEGTKGSIFSPRLFKCSTFPLEIRHPAV